MTSPYDGIIPDNDASQGLISDPDPKNEIKDVEKIAQLTTKIAKGQKRINNIRVVERVINLLASCLVAGIMAYTLDVYIVNQNEKVNGMGPFGSNPKLWPTYVMTTVAGVTLIFNLSVLLAYCSGRRAADKVSLGSTFIKLLSPLGHLIIWGTGAGAFNLATTGTDIWTFSCSEDPSVVAIQQNFENKVNYDMLCKLNTGGSYTAIATACFAAIGIIIWIIITIYERKQKKRQVELDAARRFDGYRNSSTTYPPQQSSQPVTYVQAQPNTYKPYA
ncbi:hypothetical protein ABW19_dt0204784 [Dactylella cylindrospora]|nr:hypothetical protein ABW19_dt0204784 [Dactylella cylindrospora]